MGIDAAHTAFIYSRCWSGGMPSLHQSDGLWGRMALAFVLVLAGSSLYLVASESVWVFVLVLARSLLYLMALA